MSIANKFVLVDANAQPKTQQLYKFLQSDSKGIMFGHQDSLSYGIGWKYHETPGECDIKKVCGDFPAVFGWDLGHIETGSDVNIDAVPFALMQEQIVRAHEMGAINTISWHPVNPITGGNTWDVSVRVLEQILPGGESEKKFKSWLVTVGTFLKSLKDSEGNNVPIIFRPYHEHTGSWFWWGNDFCTKEEYIKLWRYTVSVLRDELGCHNLLYCYSADKVTSGEQYLEKYPGDEWVDVLGIDVYDFPHQGVNYEKVLPECLKILESIGKQKNKPYALTETGNLCVKPEKWWTDSLLRLVGDCGIKWFLVWINIEDAQYYAPHPGNASAPNFVEFYKSDKTIFAGDLPKIFS